MKKLRSMLLLSLMVSIIFVGCANQQTANPGSSPNAVGENADTEEKTAEPAEKRVLNISGHTRMYENEEEYWNTLANNFMAENPDVEVVLNWSGSFENSVEGLRAAQLAGEQIDLFSVGAKNIRGGLVQARLCMDLTELIAPYADRWVDGVLEGATYGGKIWYFPMGSTGTISFYYNKDMFNELGLEIPANFEELVVVGNTIREAKGITPILQQGSLPVYWPMWFMETYAQTTNGNSVELTRKFLNGEYDFNNDAEVQAFALVKKFFDEGLIDTKSLNTDADGMRAAFSQGKSAMFFGGTWEYSNVVSTVNNAFEIGVFEFPSMIDGSTALHASGTGQSIIIPSFAKPENIDIIMRFMEFFTRSENAADIATAAADLLPCIKGIETETNDVYDYINKHHVNHLNAYLDWMWPAELTDIFAANIPAVGAGYMTPEDAVKDIQKNYERIISEGYVYSWWDNWSEEDWKEVTPSYIPKIYP